MFECKEFEDACKELDDPIIEEYDFFVEAMNVKIYRKYRELSGLYEYKIFGVLEGISPDICAKVYTDLEYRREWDTYAKELYEFEEEDKTGIYWNVNFPFPMSNRDYVFVREMKEYDLDNGHVWVVLGKSAPFESIPSKSRTIRVDDFQQSMSMTSDGGSGTKAFMHYYDNPKGMLPTWLINWAAKTGVPNFISDMKKYCEKYPAYLEKKSEKEKKLEKGKKSKKGKESKDKNESDKENTSEKEKESQKENISENEKESEKEKISVKEKESEKNEEKEEESTDAS